MTDDVRKIKYKKPDNIFQIVASSVSINILSLAVPILTLQLYDRIIPNPGSGTLPTLVTGVLIVLMLELVMRLGRAYILAWSGAVFEHDFSKKSVDHILKSDIAHINKSSIGEHLQRMASIAKVRDFKNNFVTTVYIDMAFVPVYLTLVSMVGGPLVIVPAVMLMFFCLISLFQGQSLRHHLQTRENADDRRYDFLIESLQGIHTIKSFSLENIFIRRYEAVQNEASKANYNVTKCMSLTFNTGLIFGHAMLLFVTCAGAILVIKGYLTTGALIASVLLSGRIMQPVQKGLALWARHQDYSLAQKKINDIMELPIVAQSTGEQTRPERLGNIEIKNISFSLPDIGSDLVQGFSCNITRGETVIIDCERDEIKTVLLELMAGIYPVQQGEIMIDGCNILKFPSEQLTSYIGYIAAEPLIFRGSIRDNMTCFGLIEEAKAQEIAHMLDVGNDVRRLPSGFDTLLTGGSSDIVAPGLRQRIAMVRALANKPRIILFDNADSSLDKNGYDLVYRLLAKIKGMATLILVTDDANIRRIADRVIQLPVLKVGSPEKISHHFHHKAGHVVMR